jgi:hypothetical protein
MKKATRRSLLLAGLGAAQVALLERFGYGPLAARPALAAEGAPTRLLTIYVPGGWMPVYLFCPLSTPDIQKSLPTPIMALNEPAYFLPEWVQNLDGSGDSDAGSKVQRLRVPALWDATALAAGQPDGHIELAGASGITSVAHGWSWVHHKLWENASVVHGVDQGTATHASGVVSALCGAAGADFRAPAVHAVVANAFYDAFKEDRALPSVAVGGAPVPQHLDLPAQVAPSVLSSTQSVQWLLSERNEKAWNGIDDRMPRPQLDFSGKTLDAIGTTAIDEYALKATRDRKGRSSEGTDAFLEKLYDGTQGVSKVLARDVISILEKTKGVEYNPTNHWAFSGDQYPWGSSISTNDADSGGNTWGDRFDLTLRLLKSNLTTAVSLNCPGINGFYFDTHGTEPGFHFTYVRSVFDIIGRLLGEMKATPVGNGKSLLDDTLVLIISEFARTWPHAQDHWPTTSVVFAGGGVAPNKMLGSYDVSIAPAVGYLGTPVDLIDEGGDPTTRAPRSADVIHSAYRILGVDKFFIPGGSAEIVGLKA